jgi:hypothetical protein
MWGLGAGYAYEWEFVRDRLRFELGVTVGFYSISGDEWSLGIAVFRPTLHVAIKPKYVWFSFGPRAALPGFWGGFVAGLTVRL